MSTENMHASPQFWESATVGDPRRLYFTAEGDGRVIAGATNLATTLRNEQVADLANWLTRVGGLMVGQSCATCNVDSDGTRIYPDGQGAPDCPTCNGTGETGAERRRDLT